MKNRDDSPARVKPWVPCRTLWRCDISGPLTTLSTGSAFRACECTDRRTCAKHPYSQARHWTRRVLHQPLNACRA
jgi:hypothetical protein